MHSLSAMTMDCQLRARLLAICLPESRQTTRNAQTFLYGAQ